MASSPYKGRPGNIIVEGEVVRLDYQRFEGKSFFKCTLVYAGGLPPTLINCDFIETLFAFEGAAQQTINFLGNLSGGSLEGSNLVKSILGIGDA